jgi:uncharacterized protein
MCADRRGILLELSEDECLALLARKAVGRLAVVAEDQPYIFPVNYLLDGSHVLFRTDPGLKLSHASLQHVAFEVDDVDPVGREGWSVHVTGTAEEISEAIDDEALRERALPVQPWAEGDKAHWVRILRPTITGRRIRQPN